MAGQLGRQGGCTCSHLEQQRKISFDVLQRGRASRQLDHSLENPLGRLAGQRGHPIGTLYTRNVIDMPESSGPSKYNSFGGQVLQMSKC